MSKKRLQEGEERIGRRRRAVEERLHTVRSAIADETGHAPRGRGLLTALIAATVGLSIALRGRARKQGRLPAGDE